MELPDRSVSDLKLATSVKSEGRDEVQTSSRPFIVTSELLKQESAS